MLQPIQVRSSADLTNVRGIGRGICGAQFVTYNGEIWIRKAVAQENEVATYLLSDALGYKFVPETIYVRDENWNLFSFQRKIKNFKHWYEVSEDEKTPDVCRKLAHVYLFDYLIQNQDRHGSNFLFDLDSKEPVCIDHHITFGAGSFEPFTEYSGDVDTSVSLAEFVWRFNRANLSQVKEILHPESFEHVIQRGLKLAPYGFKTIREFSERF